MRLKRAMKRRDDLAKRLDKSAKTLAETIAKARAKHERIQGEYLDACAALFPWSERKGAA